MKSSMIKTLVSVFVAPVFVLTASVLMAVAVLPALAQAKDIDLGKDFDSLGGNEKLYKRAKALDPKNRVSIVQKRVVDRDLRLELGVNYGVNAGGDAYLTTQNLGGGVDFHINPRWSVGGRFYTHYNSLTSEGRAAFDDARRRRLTDPSDPNIRVSPTDHPESTMLGTVSWYPVYGKTNLFDLAVVQFDMYTLAGYGRVKLKSGWSDAITAGGGVGFWLTQHVSSRIEGRWQTYEDRPDDRTRRLNVGILTVSLGLML